MRGTPPFHARGGRRFERGAERVVAAKRLEIRVVPREAPILGIDGDGAFQVRDRFRVLAALGVRDGQHVERVIVVGILVANQVQVRDGFVVPATVDRQCRREQPFFDRLRPGRLRTRGLPLTDVQVEADALQELLFFRKLPEHRFEETRRRGVVVALKCIQPTFVDGDGFDIRRSPLGRSRRGGRDRWRGRPRGRPAWRNG